MAPRKPYIAGNWKMHLHRDSAVELASHVRRGVEAWTDGARVALIPPFVYLESVARELEGSKVTLGAQDVCAHKEGAYTGAISVSMLADVGCTFALVGHSERRHVFGDDDDAVAAKLRAVLDGGLEGVLCVGEQLAERDAGKSEYVVREQTTRALAGVSADEMARVTIAYEPVWAIGTGRTASAAQASEVHLYLRGLITGLYDDKIARAVCIQYGGSVKPDNAAELLAAPGIDGALVGGAALKHDSFLKIAAAAPR